MNPNPVPRTSAAPAFDIFISYSRSSSLVQAEQLRQALSAQGFTVFKDDASLQPGDRWFETLETAVAQCKTFVVLVGPEGLTRWVGAETTVALRRHFGAHQDAERPLIVPVLMPGHAALPPFLAQFQGLHWVQGQPVPSPLLGLLNGQLALPRPPPTRIEGCPYQGLAPFESHQAALFFGRETETLDALAHLGDPAPLFCG